MENQTKLNVLFVCHGNICRSPMAEFVLRRLLKQAGWDDRVEVASAATSDEEIGNPVYPLAKRTLAIRGIGCRDKEAQKITRKMFDAADFVVLMDKNNVANIGRMFGEPLGGKVKLLLDFLPADDPKHGEEIADPWYTRDFDTAYNEIQLGCRALMHHIAGKLGIEQ